jgi:glycosyltransferase involved in cell wall biosynthesis
MILLDATHTAHCRANTGIQRVTRRIYRELGADATLAIHDLYGHCWRQPDKAETALMRYVETTQSGKKRGAAWSFSQKLRGRVASLGLHRRGGIVTRARALLVPEIFAAPRTPAAFAQLRRQVDGPAIALFHDLIPLLMPGHTPAATVAKFESYLAAMRTFDAVAAVSEFSRDALLDYWRKRGESHPPVYAIPLGVDVPATPCLLPSVASGRRLSILCVGTLEGRKNHLALLRAAEALWSSGLDFELTLFGGLNKETAGDAAALAEQLIRAGRPLRWVRGGSDAQMEAEYARADFTVYPSLMEGFGLPVLESLARGRPCVCSGENAIAETARDGGCLTIGTPTASALAEGIRVLLLNRQLLTSLQQQAASLKIRTWSDYAADLKWLALGK